MAIRLYMTLNTMFRWARRRELVSTHPMELVNSPGSYKARERVLDQDELRHVWRAFGEIKNPSLSRSLKLVILTWQRRTEVGHLPWAEIAEDQRWWYLRRTKNRKRSAVFLAPTSRAILERQRGRSSVYCFPGPDGDKPLCSPYMTSMCWNISRSFLKEGKIREKFTVHDLRRTGATLAREHGADRAVVKRILNHSAADVTAIYDRYGMKPEVQQVLTSYDEFIRDLVGL